VREYVRLNRPDVARERVPQVCYINFLSDFFTQRKTLYELTACEPGLM
jgi:hypothetical protein